MIKKPTFPLTRSTIPSALDVFMIMFDNRGVSNNPQDGKTAKMKEALKGQDLSSWNKIDWIEVNLPKTYTFSIK